MGSRFSVILLIPALLFACSTPVGVKRVPARDVHQAIAQFFLAMPMPTEE